MPGVLKYWNGSAWAEVEVSAPVGPQGPIALTVSATAPSTTTAGYLWYNSETGKLFSYYDSFWIDVSGAQGPVGPTGPTGPADALTSSRLYR